MSEKTKKLLKVIFTLSSGKSIVNTLNEDNAYKAYEDWKMYVKTVNEGKTSDSNILEVFKYKDGDIYEKLGIDLQKIDSIQIEGFAGTGYNDN